MPESEKPYQENPVVESITAESESDSAFLYEPPHHVNTKEMDRESLISFRNKQSQYSRLAEVITGLRPEDPGMAERLIEDQKIVRAKYGLPSISELPNILDYERFLKKKADQLGVNIYNISSCSGVFKDHEVDQVGRGMFSPSEKIIHVTMHSETYSDFSESVDALEHELIHAIQTQVYPSMPIEVMEYEACVSSINADAIKDYSEEDRVQLLGLIFGAMIGSSVASYYLKFDELEDQVPKWDNPEFFLKHVDHVEDTQV